MKAQTLGMLLLAALAVPACAAPTEDTSDEATGTGEAITAAKLIDPLQTSGVTPFYIDFEKSLAAPRFAGGHLYLGDHYWNGEIVDAISNANCYLSGTALGDQPPAVMRAAIARHHVYGAQVDYRIDDDGEQELSARLDLAANDQPSTYNAPQINCYVRAPKGAAKPTLRMVDIQNAFGIDILHVERKTN